MIGAADPPDPERSRTVQPLPHYLRTFQHLTPTKEHAVRPRRGRGRMWVGVAVLGLLALTLVRRPASDVASTPEAAKRAPATHIALAPSPPPAPVDTPPVRVVERQGPTLIEKLLAEKLGTPVPQITPPREPEPQVAAAPKPAPPLPPPPAPKVEEKPVVAAQPAEVGKPVVVASAPRASAPPRLTSPLTQGTRPRPEVTAPLPAPPTAKPTTKPAPPTKPEVARKPEPAPAKPQVAAKPEPQPAREIATAPAPKPETLEVATRPEPSAPAPLPVQERPVQVQERPIQVQERPVEVQERAVPVVRVEVARPVERPVERLVVEPVPAQAVAVARVPVTEVAAADPPSADVERVAAVRTATAPAPARATGPSQDAVRGLLDRYAAAWRGHDVDTLRAIGQVTNDGQASALREYFANVGDLEVEVRVLDIRSDGDRATVRFTRRDRFRDPAGREIAKESPPIEKHVVTTPQGVRFGPSS